MEYIPAKSILSSFSKNTGWFGVNYNMNLYKGCCHGCIYCDSRSECYQIEDFDRVRTKKNALEILERELATKRKTGLIGMGGMSDPYNPYEESLNLTGRALELIDRYRFGTAIATKGVLIERDLDRLVSINSHSPVIIKMTITAGDDTLSRIVEPGAPASSLRFKALKNLSSRGLFYGDPSYASFTLY
jgi:DNA repair photolyase